MASYCVHARAPAVVVLVVDDDLDELVHALGESRRVGRELLLLDRRPPATLLRLVGLRSSKTATTSCRHTSHNITSTK